MSLDPQSPADYEWFRSPLKQDFDGLSSTDHLNREGVLQVIVVMERATAWLCLLAIPSDFPKLYAPLADKLGDALERGGLGNWQQLAEGLASRPGADSWTEVGPRRLELLNQLGVWAKWLKTEVDLGDGASLHPLQMRNKLLHGANFGATSGQVKNHIASALLNLFNEVPELLSDIGARRVGGKSVGASESTALDQLLVLRSSNLPVFPFVLTPELFDSSKRGSSSSLVKLDRYRRRDRVAEYLPFEGVEVEKVKRTGKNKTIHDRLESIFPEARPQLSGAPASSLKLDIHGQNELLKHLQPNLLGREEPLNQADVTVRAALSQAGGSFIYLQAEPGSGKSAFMAEVYKRSDWEKKAGVFFRLNESENQDPRDVFVRLLTDVFNLDPSLLEDVPPEEQLAELHESVPNATSQEERALLFVDAINEADPPKGLTPLEFLTRISRKGHVVIVSSQSAPSGAWPENATPLTTHNLGRLNEATSIALLDTLLGNIAVSRGPERLREIAVKSAGLPIYLTTAAKHLRYAESIGNLPDDFLEYVRSLEQQVRLASSDEISSTICGILAFAGTKVPRQVLVRAIKNLGATERSTIRDPDELLDHLLSVLDPMLLDDYEGFSFYHSSIIEFFRNDEGQGTRLPPSNYATRWITQLSEWPNDESPEGLICREFATLHAGRLFLEQATRNSPDSRNRGDFLRLALDWLFDKSLEKTRGNLGPRGVVAAVNVCESLLRDFAQDMRLAEICQVGLRRARLSANPLATGGPLALYRTFQSSFGEQVVTDRFARFFGPDQRRLVLATLLLQTAIDGSAEEKSSAGEIFKVICNSEPSQRWHQHEAMLTTAALYHLKAPASPLVSEVLKSLVGRGFALGAKYLAGLQDDTQLADLLRKMKDDSLEGFLRHSLGTSDSVKKLRKRLASELLDRGKDLSQEWRRALESIAHSSDNARFKIDLASLKGEDLEQSINWLTHFSELGPIHHAIKQNYTAGDKNRARELERLFIQYAKTDLVSGGDLSSHKSLYEAVRFRVFGSKQTAKSTKNQKQKGPEPKTELLVLLAEGSRQSDREQRKQISDELTSRLGSLKVSRDKHALLNALASISDNSSDTTQSASHKITYKDAMALSLQMRIDGEVSRYSALTLADVLDRSNQKGIHEFIEPLLEQYTAAAWQRVQVFLDVADRGQHGDTQSSEEKTAAQDFNQAAVRAEATALIHGVTVDSLNFKRWTGLSWIEEGLFLDNRLSVVAAFYSTEEYYAVLDSLGPKCESQRALQTVVSRVDVNDEVTINYVFRTLTDALQKCDAKKRVKNLDYDFWGLEVIIRALRELYARGIDPRSQEMWSALKETFTGATDRHGTWLTPILLQSVDRGMRLCFGEKGPDAALRLFDVAAALEIASVTSDLPPKLVEEREFFRSHRLGISNLEFNFKLAMDYELRDDIRGQDINEGLRNLASRGGSHGHKERGRKTLTGQFPPYKAPNEHRSLDPERFFDFNRIGLLVAAAKGPADFVRFVAHRPNIDPVEKSDTLAVTLATLAPHISSPRRDIDRVLTELDRFEEGLDSDSVTLLALARLYYSHNTPRFLGEFERASARLRQLGLVGLRLASTNQAELELIMPFVSTRAELVFALIEYALQARDTRDEEIQKLREEFANLPAPRTNRYGRR